MEGNWLKVSIYTTPEGLEPLFGALLMEGIEGVEICDEGDFLDFIENNRSKWDYIDDEVMREKKAPTHLNVFLRDDSTGMNELDKVKNCLERLKKEDMGIDFGSLETAFDSVPENLWFERWKKYYIPLKIGDGILIVPEWEETPKTDRKVVKINPGMLFGTGSHNTTRLCMETLERIIKGGESVVDFGCGSGILSILSVILGAKQASAVDIDEAAEHIAYENAALNGIYKDRYFVKCGNVLEENPFENTPYDIKYDIVVANIVADVIIPLSAKAGYYMKDDGMFLCSGIIEGRIDDVCDALLKNGFKITEKMQDGEWYALLAKKA